MQVIDRSLQPSMYWPGLHALFGMDYERLAPIYTSFFDEKPSEKAFEEFMTERAGLGLAAGLSLNRSVLGPLRTIAASRGLLGISSRYAPSFYCRRIARIEPRVS